VSNSAELGDQKEVHLDSGTIRYRERGSGPAIVFVHPLLTNGDLWRHVVPELASEYRCIAPDWPIGGHETPMNRDADLSAPGLARIIVDFLAALDLSDVTLVGHDTGGALSQIVVTEYPERIGRLVLLDCDAYENFPPKLLLPIVWSARLPGGDYLLVQSMRIAPLRRLPIAFGWLTKRPIDREIVMGSYLRPCLTNSDVRRDTRKFIKSISHRYTLAAAKKFADFTKPVLIVWTPEDRIFPWKYAERLVGAFPNARLERIDDSYTFVPEDQPHKLAQAIASFMKSPWQRGPQLSQEAAQ